MSQANEGNSKTFECDEALAIYRCVKMDSDGKVTYADGADEYDGVTTRATFAAGEFADVALASKAGTVKVTAGAACTAGDHLYGAADGKVSGSGHVLRGKALETASGDGSIIEMLPMKSSQNGTVKTVAAAGSAQGDAAALTGKVNIVTGSDGTKGVILPSAQAGLEVTVYNSVATNGLKVYPATSDDINDGTVNAAVTIEGKTMAIFKALDATTWGAIYTADS